MMNTRFVPRLCWAFLAAALTMSGCLGGNGNDNPCAYPSAPKGVENLRYVSKTCLEATSDGTSDLPFATITEALSDLGGPGAVLIGAGSYDEHLLITSDDIQLIGGKDANKNPGVLIQGSKNEAIIKVVAANDVVLANLVFKNPVEAAVKIEGGSVVASSLLIDGATSDESNQTGHGVWALNGAKLELQDSTIQNNEGIGVLLSEAYGIILNNKIGSNARGGILTTKAPDEVEISENTLNSNTIFGIGIVETRGIILNNLVADTVSPDGKSIADGIHITGQGSYADIQGNEVWKSARSGIFFSGDVRGIILNNMVATNGMGGIWLQNGAGASAAIEIKENQITSNIFVGIGVSADAYGIILNNLVANTGALSGVSPENAMGDAILIKNQGWAQVENNVLNSNARAAVLAHYASEDSQVLNNVGAGNLYGVIVQGTEIADFEDLTFAEPREEEGGEPPDAGAPNDPKAQDTAFAEEAPADELPVSEDPFDSID